MLPPQFTTDKLKAKDDFQVMLVILLIAFITGVKLYMMSVNNNPSAGQQAVASYALKDADMHLWDFQQNLHVIK